MSKRVMCFVIVGLLLGTAAVAPAQGLKGEYFKNMASPWTPTGTPALTRTENVNFNWGDAAPDATIGADLFSVRWTGGMTAPVTGTYVFRTYTDDGIRVWINEVLVIDNWTDHAGTWNNSPDIDLIAGTTYPIKVEFYENGGGAICQLFWSYPGQTEVAIPASALSTKIPPKVPYLYARKPSPANGSIGALLPLLTWTPGETAVSEDVYLGTSPDLTVADRVVNHQSSLFKMYYHVAPPLVQGQKYYWRVDDFDAAGNIFPGEVWSFTMAPLTAFGPSPRDGFKWTDPNASLSWQPGQNATKHDLYFGTDQAKVAARDASVFKGLLLTASFDLPTLTAGATYYWLVDEYDAASVKHEGAVWSFTTLGPSAGIRGEYFKSTDLSGVPAVVRTDPGIDFYWNPQGTGFPGAGFPEDNFSVRWTAMLEAPSSEAFVFRTGADDGARLYLDGQLIIDNWPAAGQDLTWTDSAPIDLVEGQTYLIVAEMFELAGEFDAHLLWRSQSIAQQVIPAGPLQLPLKASGPMPRNADVNAPRDVVLMWSAGESAATHDVYFGTDQAAVEAATTADTAVYKGNQALEENTFAPGTLEFDTTYYWRIDEVNDGAADSPWKGSVWSFTTADFIVVDDFESYTNDSPYRIFQTWIDGYGFSEDDFFPSGNPGNGTGSAVGHDIWATGTPYTKIVETSTVRPGSRQSMPLAYNNADSPFNSEAERTWTSPQDWTLNNSKILSLQVYGYRAAPAPVTVTETSGKMNVTGAGADLWGSSDEFTFAYKTLNGDGTLIAKVVSNGTGNNTWAKGGVMIRDSLDGNSAHAMMVMTGSAGNGAAFQNRATAGLDQSANDATSTLTVATVIAPPYWVKIERSGDTFTGSTSPDGTAWTVLSTAEVVMTAPVYIGLCVTSHDPGVDRTYQFEGIKTTGSVSGQWQGAVIDSPIWNSQQDLYVVLQDSLNKSFVVTNATAVNSGDWLDVQIPLSQFTGVNPAKIKKMIIGVGKRTNPVADGTGELFIDDIRVIKPTP